MTGATRILIVDDEPDLREILALDFEMAGYQVACAEDGKQALSMLEKEKFDAVISDVRMPLGRRDSSSHGAQENTFQRSPSHDFYNGVLGYVD